MAPEHTDSPERIQQLDADASALMKEGIRLLEQPGADSAAAALTCFDRALTIRGALPIEQSPRLRYGLAACWLNRADALVRLGGRGELSMALRAYDEGIVLMRTLTLSEDPLYARRLAIAHQNRGMALQFLGAASWADAVGAFSAALDVLDSDDAAGVPDRRLLAAGISINLANTLLASDRPDHAAIAREHARRAVALVGGDEPNDAELADIGVKARHLLCQVAARQLNASAGDDVTAIVHDATDLVDDGLTIVRTWEQQGETRLRRLAHDLFRFGARLYATFQPQFLDEFITENMDPRHSSQSYVDSEEMRAAWEDVATLLESRRV